MKRLHSYLIVLGLLILIAFGVMQYMKGQDVAQQVATVESSATSVSESSQAETAKQVAESTDSQSETSASSQTSQTASQLTPAPVTTLLNELGSEMKLSDLYGKPTVINIWASWCPPCREEMPHFQKAYDTYGDKVNFVMLNATGSSPTETRETAAAYIQKEGYKMPIYYDVNRNNQLKFNVNSLPMTIVLNDKGEVLKVARGLVSEEALLGALKEITTN